jgi:hypothetical protein
VGTQGKGREGILGAMETFFILTVGSQNGHIYCISLESGLKTKTKTARQARQVRQLLEGGKSS